MVFAIFIQRAFFHFRRKRTLGIVIHFFSGTESESASDSDFQTHFSVSRFMYMSKDVRNVSLRIYLDIFLASLYHYSFCWIEK